MDTENEGGFAFWNFLKDWPTLDETERQKKYDKFACHEVNIFLYFRDRPFFDCVILPFIANKIEKTFVDFFLLSDEARVLENASPEVIDQLNAMETILLVITLMRQPGRKEFHERAAMIAKKLEQ